MTLILKIAQTTHATDLVSSLSHIYICIFNNNNACTQPWRNRRTWGYTLKAKGWRNLGTLAEVDDAQLRMRNSLKMGLYINVAGMLLALIGAEQIVGTLVAKVLYSQGEDERKSRAPGGGRVLNELRASLGRIRRQAVCVACVLSRVLSAERNGSCNCCTS